MIKFNVYSIGKTKENFVLLGEAEYLKRIKKKATLNIIEIDSKDKGNETPEQTMAREGEAILKRIGDDNFLIALDRGGKELSSLELSTFFTSNANRGISTFNLVVGGAWGLSPVVLERANLILSLSKLTMPHQLARLFLIEQVYRSLAIAAGEPYHK